MHLSPALPARLRLAVAVVRLLSLGWLTPAFAQFQFSGVDPDLEVVARFDRNGDGRLDRPERDAARVMLEGLPWGSRAPGPYRGPVPEGPRLRPSDVKTFADEPFYDLPTLRTLFIEFDAPDWEDELQTFFHTDVDVPARLTVDGKTLAAPIGVGFRGHASYSTVSPGRKRSFNLSIDSVDSSQRLHGFRSLNLLNSNSDPTFLRLVLYFHLARQYTDAPRANFVRVVINGESWGIYVNVEQINSDFARDNFGSGKGARWKVPGAGRSLGGLAYLGDDPEAYRQEYELKTKEDPKSWSDLIHLARVLNSTPPARLEAALEPILDVQGALGFLAIDKALVNNDGYWTRASDYGLAQDSTGRFHAVPWDANETWREVQRGRGNVALDPFAGQDDPRKALLHRLLAVPALRQRYLAILRDIADRGLDWKRLEPLVRQMQDLIAADVRADTRKIYSTAAFTQSVTQDGFEPRSGRAAPPWISLKNFAIERRAYLLAHPAIRSLPRDVDSGVTRAYPDADAVPPAGAASGPALPFHLWWPPPPR